MSQRFLVRQTPHSPPLPPASHRHRHTKDRWDSMETVAVTTMQLQIFVIVRHGAARGGVLSSDGRTAWQTARFGVEGGIDEARSKSAL